MIHVLTNEDEHTMEEEKMRRNNDEIYGSLDFG